MALMGHHTVARRLKLFDKKDRAEHISLSIEYFHPLLNSILGHHSHTTVSARAVTQTARAGVQRTNH